MTIVSSPERWDIQAVQDIVAKEVTLAHPLTLTLGQANHTQV